MAATPGKSFCPTARVVFSVLTEKLSDYTETRWLP